MELLKYKNNISFKKNMVRPKSNENEKSKRGTKVSDVIPK